MAALLKDYARPAVNGSSPTPTWTWPEIARPTKMRKHVGLGTLHMFDVAKKGSLLRTWNSLHVGRRHGAGVILHRGRVSEVGQGDCEHVSPPAASALARTATSLRRKGVLGPGAGALARLSSEKFTWGASAKRTRRLTHDLSRRALADFDDAAAVQDDAGAVFFVPRAAEFQAEVGEPFLATVEHVQGAEADVLPHLVGRAISAGPVSGSDLSH